jgi:hypothetical protein
MTDKNEVREFLTDQGIVKVVRLHCQAIDGTGFDSIYLQLQIELPGGKHIKVWVSKKQLDIAVTLGATVIYARTDLPFVVEAPRRDGLFDPETSVNITGVHRADCATVIPVYRSRAQAVAAA